MCFHKIVTLSALLLGKRAARESKEGGKIKLNARSAISGVRVLLKTG